MHRQSAIVINHMSRVIIDFFFQLITISPHRGELLAGESCICRVTFIALGDPSFFDLDLVCEVTNLTDYHAYCDKVADWEAERLRQQVEFTITEENDGEDGVSVIPDTCVRILKELLYIFFEL